MTGLRPSPSALAEPSAVLAFTLRAPAEGEVDPAQVVITVDGRDVTERCVVRLPRLWPADRADYSYHPTDGWSAGGHEVSVTWNGVLARSWHFEVSQAT